MSPLAVFDDLRRFDYRAFLRWWGSELSFLVPGPLSRWWRRRSNRVLLRVGDAAMDLNLCSAAGARSLGQWAKEDGLDAALGALIAAESEAVGAENVLLLTGLNVLRRSVVLPAAARENLTQVIGFELDRYTPFKQAQLYYDARLVESLADGVRIRVEFAAVPKDYLDTLLGRLAVAGIRPGCVTVESPGQELAPAEFNLLPEQDRPRRSGLALRLTQVLAGVLCLLFAAIGAVPVVMDGQFVDDLREEVRRVSKAAKEVETMREETDQLGRAAAFVLEKKLGQPPLLIVLDDITARLPDVAWLSAMQVREGRVEMQGVTKTASALIALIEDSPYLRNTAFLAPVTPDSSGEMERFRIGADIVGPAASGDGASADSPWSGAADAGDEESGNDAE